jgi:hypothetical protein
MSTLKAFLKGKNKEELIEDLKLIQNSLEESGVKTDQQGPKKQEKTKGNNNFLSSLSNKFKSKS